LAALPSSDRESGYVPSLFARRLLIGAPCIFLVLLAAPPLAGRTLVVDASGGAAFIRIQDAIDAASPGDTVLVRPGRYLERLSIVGVDLHLVSSDGPQATTIDGGGSGPVIRCVGLSSNSSIVGFTITGGVTRPPLVGGGVYLAAESSPSIRDNVIVGNRAEATGWVEEMLGPDVRAGGVCPGSRMPFLCEPVPGSGGGVFVYFRCFPVIEDNVIADNSAAADGGGVVFWDHADGVLRGNEIYRNTSGRSGGGVFVGCNAMPTIERNVLAWNEASAGGGIAVDGVEADAAVLRNTLYRNSAPECGGIRCKGPCKPAIEGNVFVGNGREAVFCDPDTQASLSCNAAWQVGEEPFGSDCFAFGELPPDNFNERLRLGFCDAEAGDFRLCSQPLLEECGEIGAEDLTCPLGRCVSRVSWGVIRALYK